jgi:uracil-DNA glycosylase
MDIEIESSWKTVLKPEFAKDYFQQLTAEVNTDYLLNQPPVLKGKPGSHQGKGWEQFTDAVIERVSNEKNHVVFLLWGNFARSKAKLIDSTKHCILEAPHPSPLSAHNGFFGCQHFSKTNNYLKKQGLTPIDW